MYRNVALLLLTPSPLSAIAYHFCFITQCNKAVMNIIIYILAVITIMYVYANVFTLPFTGICSS